jgi:cell division protein FtsI (penicillin-binding protein 3)
VRSEDLRRTSRRIRAVSLVIALGLAGLAARATHLAVIDRRGADRGESQTTSTYTLPAPRGLILDRNGAELALSVDSPSVYADPRAVADRPGTAKQLAKLLGREEKTLRARLERNGQFAYLARWVSEETAKRVAALDLPGIAILREARRAYPQRSLAAHVLGFANIDGVGVRGVEQLEDAWLRGEARAVPVLRDARRRALASAEIDPRRAAGGDVALTIDAAVQAEAEQALADGVAAAKARGGLVVAMDPKTGDVIALAEHPPFDPNAFRDTPFERTRARSFLDAVEPGSTMKPIVVAAALEKGAIRANDRIDCEGGAWRVPGKTLRDFHPHGILDVEGVIRVSSNIGAAKIGYEVGPEFHYDVLRKLGFGAPSGLGFPDESAGLLRPWKRWRPVDHATISFGQGISVTPVQLAAAFGAFANDGVWQAPRLVLGRRSPGGALEPVKLAPGRRAMKPEVARAVLHMMESVVGEEGTGKRAALRGVRVAGKTGTAQKIDPETGFYSQRSYLGWFVGVAPVEDPKLVIAVMIDEPRGVRVGGVVAAPVFARVAAAQLARYDILTEPEIAPPGLPSKPLPVPPPHRDADDLPVRQLEARATLPKPEIPPAPVDLAAEEEPQDARLRVERLGDAVLVPDFSGRSAEEVRRATAGTRLRVEASGEGSVIGQDPAPGTILGGDGTVRVRFAPPRRAALAGQGH